MTDKLRTKLLTTRLCRADLERFEALVKARNIKATELAREALVFYLDNHPGGAQALQENKIERRLKSIEDRYASLLVRIGIDVATMAALMSSRIAAGQRKETMEVAYRVATKHFNKKLEGVAQELKNNLSRMT
jgi:hypothetical protein